MNPIARSDQIIKQEVSDEETLVYDRVDHMAYCLNSLAAGVWKHCDGQHSIKDIAEIIVAEIDLPEEADPQSAVRYALEELERCNLISSFESTEGVSPQGPASDISRRQVLKAALAGAALFPAIISIVAPTPAMANSGEGPTDTPSPTPTNTGPTDTPSPTPPEETPPEG